MGSSSEFAAGPGAPAASEGGGGDEPEASGLDGGFAELRRESAAMLRTLADKYDSESEDSRARSARLLAESEAAGALAVQLAEESVRIRTEADRLAAPPTWMPGSSPDAAQAHSGTSGGTDQPSTPDSGTPAPGTAAAASEATDSDATDSTATEPGTTPPPGPGPARGFAPNAGSTAEGTQHATPTRETDDWAPRPFESWRNKASQVTPRLLEL